MQPEVVLYGTPTCAPCDQAKRWFSEHGVAYTYHDVSRDPVRAAELVRLTGQNAVPVIRVGGQVMIGFDPLQLARLIPFNAAGGTAAANGTGERLSLGMAAQSLTPEKAEEVGLPAPFGVVVGNVREDGPAARAGIKPGDVIVGVGSYTLQNLAQLQNIVLAKRPGDTLSVRVFRDGQEFDTVVEFPLPEPAAETEAPPVASEQKAG
jgi:S1-C subfamily serine protease